MNFLTQQEIFDKVAAHLTKQGVKSIGPDVADGMPMCMYRDPKGNRCAAGALIEVGYRPELESQICYAGPVADALSANGVSREDTFEIVHSLQNVHDSYSPEYWPIELDKVAAHYNLKPYRP